MDFLIYVHVSMYINVVSIYPPDIGKLMSRAVEIPCPTCPTWSHFIQDKLKISIYLSLDKYKCIKLIKVRILYFD